MACTRREIVQTASGSGNQFCLVAESAASDNGHFKGTSKLTTVVTAVKRCGDTAPIKRTGKSRTYVNEAGLCLILTVQTA